MNNERAKTNQEQKKNLPRGRLNLSIEELATGAAEKVETPVT